MPRVRLTDRFTAGLKPSVGQVDYFDEATAGLFLRVSATQKSWGLLFTRPADGKRARTTFGRYPDMTLASARARAIELRGGLSDGKDASVAVREIKTGICAGDMTLRELARLFVIDRRERGRRTVDEMERALTADVLPVIGNVAVQKLRRLDLSRVTDRIRARGSLIQANRVAASLKAMTAWAVDKGIIETDPGHRWKPPSEARAPRERSLSAAEIKKLWSSLETAGMSRWTIELLRFCLATGCRQGEAAGMVRNEVDLDGQSWTIPASRSKNKREHVVPLSAQAVTILKGVLDAHELSSVFPGPKGTPLTNSGVARAVQRSQEAIGLERWTAHDLRRTAATFMAELGVSPYDIGLVLNHITTTKGTVTTSVYVRHDFLPQKRAALEVWGSRLQEIIATATVVAPNQSRKRYGVLRANAA